MILYHERPGRVELRVCRILSFFGIPFEMRRITEALTVGHVEEEGPKYAVLGPIDIGKVVLHQSVNEGSFRESVACAYLYATEDVCGCEKILQSMLDLPNSVLRNAGGRTVRLKVNGDFAGVTGPMTGIGVSARLGDDHCVYYSGSSNPDVSAIISSDDGSVYFLTELKGVPCFVATSAQMPDLDAAVEQGYYDVKSNFCSAVPLILFLRYVFSEVMWQPVEHGACIIIDDPLLKPRYGCCDLRKLLEQMAAHGFTTDIAFIPWNHWRTSTRDSAMFRGQSGRLSVSIHGCDHVAAEFGDSPCSDLARRARLALSRMRHHEGRTGVRHDPIMIFPQGVFSSSIPEVLKTTGYMAAVNTEISPVGDSRKKTLLRDVWDIAITRYGSFPIFTRRYASHGLENFAFDLLLGKPCLIVAHHDFFKNEGEAVIDLAQSLCSLHGNLQWGRLGEVLRRACRQRVSDSGVHEYQMYCQELWIGNLAEAAAMVTVRKGEDDPDLIAGVEGGQEKLAWRVGEGYIEFWAAVAAGETRLFKVRYKEQFEEVIRARGLKYELQVATRRILSELRDESIFQKERLKEVVGRAREYRTKA